MDNNNNISNIYNEYFKQFNVNNTNKYNDINPYDINNQNNIALLKSLKEEIGQLENEKKNLQDEITQLRKNVKNLKKDDYSKKIQQLENIRNETKKTATHYLHLCSQLAEEVIVLRDQLDKYSHVNN